jgi:hypothetical protein
VGTHTHTSEPRLSEIFARTLDANADGVVVLGEVLDKAGNRGYGFLLILLAIPAFIPILPPGTSGVLGALMSIVALQMLFGLKQPWFPKRWRNKVLSPKVVQALQTRGVAMLRQIERVSHPRGRRFTRNGLILRLSALVVIALALVLSSPMPFMNTLPCAGRAAHRRRAGEPRPLLPLGGLGDWRRRRADCRAGHRGVAAPCQTRA